MRWGRIRAVNTGIRLEHSTITGRRGVQSLVDEVKEQYPLQAFFYRHFGKIALAIVLIFAFLLGFAAR